jgi:hypothetical protein
MLGVGSKGQRRYDKSENPLAPQLREVLLLLIHEWIVRIIDDNC